MSIVIRPLREHDLADADRIFRLAFGTFLGMPDPTRFAGDSDWTASRWRADPSAAFAAEVDGRFVGSNFATGWGSVGFFGPLTVHPECWNGGVAQRLLEPTMDCFARWGTRHAGLFTFAQSAKHVALYRRFGFYPRFLTAIMERQPGAGANAPEYARFSDVSADERAGCVDEVRELTNAVFDGLDVTREILAIAAQRLGETLLLWHGARLVAVALCHVGAGSEAGTGQCYVKFGAARPDGDRAAHFARLLDAVEAYARSRDAVVQAGVNLGRQAAYEHLLARGYRTVLQGVAMHRPNASAYHGRDDFVLDDWR